MMYHDPEPEIFETHLRYLKTHFNIISLKLLSTAIIEGNWRKIPSKSLIITFDDGHQGNFSLLPVIEKYNIPVTIYACSQLIGTHRHFWFLDFPNHGKQLKTLTNSERLKRLFVMNGYQPEKEFSQRQALSIEEVLRMKEAGIDFQSHTRTHPILTSCTDEECFKEIAGSKEELENLLQTPISHFAYPGGNYKKREMHYLQKFGYLSARSTDIGWNGPSTNIYALKVMPISDDATLNEMIAQLHGIFPFFRIIKKKISN